MTMGSLPTGGTDPERQRAFFILTPKSVKTRKQTPDKRKSKRWLYDPANAG